MAIQDKERVGFVKPIKPVELSSSTGNPRLINKQRIQGGQSTGGGQGNTNNAGNTGVVGTSQPFLSNQQSKLANKAVEAISTIAKPASTVQPNIYNPPAPAQIQFKAGLNNSPILSDTVKSAMAASNESSQNKVGIQSTIPTTVAQNTTTPQIFSKAEMTVPTESQKLGSVVNDRVQQGEFGQAGGVKYALDDAGKVIRQDSSGSKYLQSRVSSMGPNGSTVSRELRPNEVTALDRSKQMISDWKDYKEEQQFKNLISGRPASSQLSAIAVRNADLTDRAQVAANSENQRIGQELQSRQIDLTAKNNAFSQQKDVAQNNRENLKAESEIQNRNQNQQIELAKVFQKGITDNNEPAAIYASMRQASPGGVVPTAFIRAMPGLNKKFSSREEAISAGIDAGLPNEAVQQFVNEDYPQQ